MTTALLCSVVASFAVAYFVRTLINILRPNKGKVVPRIGSGLPFFGQVFTMLKGSPWDQMALWALEYGTFYILHLFGSDSYVVSDPELLKIILQTKLSIFKKDVDWTYKPFLVILGNGLVTAEGTSWRKQRNLLSSHLRMDILDEIPIMTISAVERLKLKLDKVKKEGTPMEMAEEFRHLTLQVITEAILSLPPGKSDETFAHMYLPIVEESNLRTWSPQRMYLPTLSWFRFRAAVKKLDDYVSSLVTDRWTVRLEEKKLEKVDRKEDVLDKVLSAIPEDDWSADSIKQVRDEMKTFIFAGHETSASMLTWTLYELICNPDCMKRVKEEAQLLFGNKKGEIPTRTELEVLRYTECCLRESLRKYSPVPSVVRVATESVDLGEYHVKKGSTIMINIQGVHQDPQFWPEPLVYKPERFLEDIKPYTFLPFIDGARMCLGQYLSILESKTVIAWLVFNYDFELVNKEEAGLKHQFMIPSTPKLGHFMRVK